MTGAPSANWSACSRRRKTQEWLKSVLARGFVGKPGDGQSIPRLTQSHPSSSVSAPEHKKRYHDQNAVK